MKKKTLRFLLVSCKNDTSYERTRSGVLLPRDHRARRRFYIKQEGTRGRAQGPPAQRRVTTTASCGSRSWPVVRASVGVSQVVRTAVDRRQTTWHFVLVADSQVDPEISFPFLFLGPGHPY